jgi:hypothetical protein
MVVKDRNNVLTDTKKNDTNDIFLLGNCIDRYLVTNKFYCSYNQLTIIGGTKLKSKYDIAPRILIRRTGNTLCCSFIENKALTESTLYSCYSKDTDKFSDKYILCLLNSKLYTYYVKKLMVTNQQAFPQILMTDLEQLPIPYLGNQQLYIDLADIMLEKNKDLQQTREAFLEFITGQFVIAKPSIKLQYWFNLSFEEFIKELEKGKVKLPSTQKFDLKPLFDREQAKAVGIKIIINDTDKKIDSMVYELYGLTDEEIKIVEGK